MLAAVVQYCWHLVTKRQGLCSSTQNDVQFYFLIRSVLSALLRRYNLQQCDATPRIPLGELTALPRTPDWIVWRSKEGEREEEEKAKWERKGKEKEVKGGN